jgi:hypothetical protein
MRDVKKRHNHIHSRIRGSTRQNSYLRTVGLQHTATKSGTPQSPTYCRRRPYLLQGKKRQRKMLISPHQSACGTAQYRQIMHYMCAAIKNCYLNTLLYHPEYMRLALNIIPQEIIDKYKLVDKKKMVSSTSTSIKACTICLKQAD